MLTNFEIDHGKTFIELTRRKEHLNLEEGLEKDLVSLLSLETIKEGQVLGALITEIASVDEAAKISCPIQA